MPHSSSFTKKLRSPTSPRSHWSVIVVAVALILSIALSAAAVTFFLVSQHEPLPADDGSVLRPVDPTPFDRDDRFAAVAPGECLVCFWNVENLFDDRVDGPEAGRDLDVDRSFDEWFARDAGARQQKLDRLSEVIVRLNGGRGPDILCLCEVESQRAAELLRDALNARLSDPQWHYHAILMKEVKRGRHIAPVIMTRYPVVANRTRQIGPTWMRTLLGTVRLRQHDLHLIVAHWTSRVGGGNDTRRFDYADRIYGQFRTLATSNPAVDLLVVGDFNDDPDDPSVTQHLRAGWQRSRGDAMRLVNLSAVLDPQRSGTLYYEPKQQWHIFDQVVASPGLFDGQGWDVLPESIRTINTLHRPNDSQRTPWRFGSPRSREPRGYSDHYPVTVRLRLPP